MSNTHRNRTGSKTCTVYQPVEDCDEDCCTCDGHGHCLDDRIKKLSGTTITFGARPGTFTASSRSVPGRRYYVTSFKGKWKCACPYHLNSRSSFCDHILAAQAVLETAMRGIRQEIKRGMVEISDPGIVCKGCKKSNYRKADMRHNKHGDTQRYWCYNCKCKFMPRLAFKGSHFPDSEIVKMLDNVCSGMRPKEAFRRMRNPDGKPPSRRTIGRMIEKYGKLLWKLSCMVARGRVGDDWAGDEVYCKVCGKKAWVFAVLDKESRYVLAFDHDYKKQGANVIPLYADSVSTAGKEPRTMITDCLDSFPEAVLAMGDDLILHIRDAGINKRHANNNIYERFNGTLKDMIRQSRGFKVLRPGMLRLFMAYYNLFWSHEGLGDISPAEYLGIRIKTETESIAGQIRVALQYAALHCQ